MKKPSVTNLIELLNKPALIKWANKIGLEGVSLDAYQKKLKSDGTSLHNQIEDYLLKETPFINPDIQKAFDRFMFDKKVIDIEQNIETDYFVGRYDIKIMVDGVKYIADFKSSNRIFFEQHLQLSAYQMANEDCKIAVIQIPEFVFKPVNINLIKHQNILKALHYIYTLKAEL